jgi:MFS family permease
MTPFRDSLRAFPRPFWVLLGATFVARFGVFVVPFLTLFMTRKGFSAADAGLAAGAYSVGSFFAAGLGGWMADRIGRNVTLAFSSLAGAASMLAFSQAEQFWWLVGLSAFTGFINESGNPASTALVQDLIPIEHRLNAYAIIRFTVNLAWSLGPMAAAFLAQYSFFWLFAGDAASSAFFGIVALLFLPRGNPTPRERAGWAHALRHIFRNRLFLALAAGQVFLAFNFRQTSTSFPLHYDRQGLPLGHLGYVLALNGVMICFLEFWMLSRTRHWSTRFAIGLGHVVIGACYLLFFGGATLGIFVATIVFFTLGEMLTFSRQQAYSASLAPEEMRGRYSGFLSLAWCVGSMTGATLGMRAYDWSPHFLWILCALSGFVGAGLLWARSLGPSHAGSTDPKPGTTAAERLGLSPE